MFNSKKFINIFYIALLIIIFNNFGNYSVARNISKSLNISLNTQKKDDFESLNPNQYLLGPGDGLVIKLDGLPELGGQFIIGPNGFIYLREIGEINLTGISLNSAKKLLIKKYENIIFEPKLTLFINSYRPINIYLKGEVETPGLYILSGQINSSLTRPSRANIKNSFSGEGSNIDYLTTGYRNILFPTLYDAIKSGGGITAYSDLSNIQVIRKVEGSESLIKANFNLMELFINGDLSKNIRIFDGDRIFIPKSDVVLSDQYQEIRSTNINPKTIKVIISRNIENPSMIEVPTGSGVIQAINIAGGKKLLSGKIEFLRFDKTGNLKRRFISYKVNSKINSRNNTQLRPGDITNVKQSALGVSTDILNKVASPFVSGYTLYNLFSD